MRLLIKFFSIAIMSVSVAYAETISPVEAHKLAKENEILLIDIRRPDEWEKTGVAEKAILLDMREKNFFDKLKNIVEEKQIEKVALICAGGVRSKHLANELKEKGFENIIDVPEGMVGQWWKKNGWVNRKLPVVEYKNN